MVDRRTGVVEATTAAERADALAVRHAVFVEEQGVPEDREVDEYDDHPDTIHFVAYASGGDGRPSGRRAIGAARLRPYGDGVGKVERVAVRGAHRGEGVGRRLMAAVERTAAERGFETLALDSQTHAAGFYERLGYGTVGEEFMDAGIPHVSMEREL